MNEHQFKKTEAVVMIFFQSVPRKHAPYKSRAPCIHCLIDVLGPFNRLFMYDLITSLGATKIQDQPQTPGLSTAVI